MRDTYDVHPILLSRSEHDPEEGSVTVGISLGGAGCAEHERGVNELRNLLSIPPQRDEKPGVENPNLRSLGLDGWLMGGCPQGCAVLQEQGNDLILVVHQNLRYEEGSRQQVSPVFMRLDSLPQHLSPVKFDNRTCFGDEKRPRAPRNKAERAHLIESTKGLRATWDDRGFAVSARGTEARDTLMTVATAYEEGRLLVGVAGGGGPFARGGLRLMDRALMPEWVIRQSVEMDLSHRALLKAVHDTGIEALLAKAGKRFFALKPAWIDRGEENGLLGLAPENTLCFWLNPYNQQEYGGGYVSVDDLRDWADNKGCIPGAGNKYPDEVRKRVGRIDPLYDRMRERLDPDGVEQARNAVLGAGVDLTTDGEGERAAFVLRPFLTDGEALGTGDIPCLLVNFHHGKGRGWFTAEEVRAYQHGEPSVLDVPSKEHRTFEAMCETLATSHVPCR